MITIKIKLNDNSIIIMTVDPISDGNKIMKSIYMGSYFIPVEGYYCSLLFCFTSSFFLFISVEIPIT